MSGSAGRQYIFSFWSLHLNCFFFLYSSNPWYHKNSLRSNNSYSRAMAYEQHLFSAFPGSGQIWGIEEASSITCTWVQRSEHGNFETKTISSRRKDSSRSNCSCRGWNCLIPPTRMQIRPKGNPFQQGLFPHVGSRSTPPFSETP